MKLKEIRVKTSEELEKLLKVNREKFRNLKFKDANKQIKNVREIRRIKKEIARILTVHSERKNKKESAVSSKQKKNLVNQNK